MALRNLDPELAPGLAGRAGTDWSLASLPRRRAERAEASTSHGPLPDTIDVSDVTTPGVGGHPPVRLRVYRLIDRPEVLAPALYWIHGGGMMLAGIEHDDLFMCHFVGMLQCTAISVDYRVAPEDPYPAPLQDCYDGLIYVAKNFEQLGIDPKRIAVGGQSAGGGLAAGTTLMARDLGGPRIVFQLLVCPMLDDRQTTVSSRIFDADVSWGRTANQAGWSAYLGDAVGTDSVPFYAAPARADDLSGLPPTFIDVGELEVFRDECIAYAMRLMADGTTTELHVYPGAYHGFDRWAPDARISQRAQRTRELSLARAFNVTSRDRDSREQGSIWRPE
jgi:acetyl esterase/lipase